MQGRGGGDNSCPFDFGGGSSLLFGKRKWFGLDWLGIGRLRGRRSYGSWKFGKRTFCL